MSPHQLDFGKYSSGPLIIYFDSQSAMKLVENPIQHQWAKHIDPKYFYARNKEENSEFTVEYAPTEEMAADALTKPVPHLKNVEE